MTLAQSIERLERKLAHYDANYTGPAVSPYEFEVPDLRNLLAAYREAVEWNSDMDAAPRDETSIDLWVQGEDLAWRVPDAWWCPTEEKWITADADYGEPGGCIGPMDRVTHWRPLPPAPETDHVD